MEGIMMRHKDKYAIAVRKPDGEIVCKVEDYKSVLGGAAIWKKPIFRGISSFVDALVVGTKCLMYSAEFFEDEDEQKKEEADEEQKAKKERREKLEMYGIVARFGFLVTVDGPPSHSTSAFPGTWERLSGL